MGDGKIVAATAVLAVLAGGGGWASGRAVAGPSGPSPSPSPSAAVTASAAPSTTPAPSPTPSPTPSAQALLEAAKRATVRLTIPGSSWGSGTVVSADGLVLTNAHVAAPQAPGLAFHYSDPATEPDPEHLVVGLSPPGDGPAVDTYRASLVVADGYLDLAVVKVDARADGSPLPPGQRFDAIPVGSVRDLETGDGITVLGFPAVAAEGDSQSVTRGEIATFARDPAGRVDAERYEIDTSARIAGGNSGGAAIDEQGRLIGVPSAAFRGGEYSGRIRPVDLAAPLLEAARNGTADTYVTPYDVLGTGEEQGEPLGWGEPGTACDELTDDELPAGSGQISGAAQLHGMTDGEDVLWALAVPGRDDPLTVARGTWEGGGDGCTSATFSPADVGSADGFDPGSYELRVHAGPQLQLLTSVPLELS